MDGGLRFIMGVEREAVMRTALTREGSITFNVEETSPGRFQA
jgi:hypothetical protein